MNVTDQDSFEAKVHSIHGNDYDLTEAIYTGATCSVIVTCRACGTTKPIRANNLYTGKQCKTCVLIARNKLGLKTTEQFILDSKQIYGANLYGYDKTVYVDATTPVLLYCYIHKKYFPKKPCNHLNNHQGCPDCGHEEAIRKNTKSTERYICDAQELYGTEHYDYTNTVYTDCREEVTIMCNVCQKEFTVLASHHMQGQGCGSCSAKEKSAKMRMPFAEFKEKAEKRHNNLYTYVENSYIMATELVEIRCNLHGTFFQEGCSHLSGAGCSICKNSRGELKISNYLQRHQLINKTQKYFKECRDKGALLFDFFIPDLDLLIEFHGRQHYEFVLFFHKTEQGFQDRLRRDKIKKDYATKHHNFLEIPYWDFDNIEQILEDKIKELTPIDNDNNKAYTNIKERKEKQR